MQTLSRSLFTGTFLLITTALLILVSNGCKDHKTAPPPDVAVNPAFEQTPPPVQDISIRQLSDNKEGNVLFVADFGQALADQRFHAVMVADEKLVLRDDGQSGDEKAGDGRFSIVLKEDINELQKEWDNAVQLARADKEFVRFNGRTMERTPVERLELRPFDIFRRGEVFHIPKFFPIRCLLPAPVIKENSLMITSPSVVEDSFRTFNPCNQRGNDTGAWAFPRLVAEMANTPVTGVTASDFLRQWLETWRTNQTVNADLIDARTQIDNIINTWSTASNGTFDIKFAPFKLVAIVNRIDLRGNMGYGFSNPGEGRFVFCAVNCTNGNLSVRRSPAPFMVIFEYGLPHKSCTALRAYAGQWAALSGMALGSAAYNTALQAITDQFSRANACAGKPNGSCLNQIRTNELAIGSPWELREFNIDSSTQLLKNVTVKQEPQLRFNKVHPARVAADVETMAGFVNDHTPDVEANSYAVPETEDGKPFLAGKAHTLNAFNYHWNGGDSIPEIITSDSARFVFSLNTCSGCHGGEAFTGNFMHVAPGFGAGGTPAILSKFLTGDPPMSSVGFVVNDRAQRPVAPGKPREFNDLERRKLDLQQFVSCPCKRRVRTFELAEILLAKPINMTH